MEERGGEGEVWIRQKKIRKEKRKREKKEYGQVTGMGRRRGE